MNVITQSTQVTASQVWFDELIATLRTHELQLETDTASPEMKNMYAIFMGNNLDEMFKVNKSTTQQYFVQKIVVEYLKQLDQTLPLKLAFNFNDSEVLVWAEIEDNDEKQEKALANAEAKINATFHPYGFDMESLIVEKSDNLPVPNHYKIFKA